MATVTKRRLLNRLLDALRRKKELPGDGRRRDGGGNAGVCEPRRPNPAPPALAASVEESD
jgi:hypothetical protein